MMTCKTCRNIVKGEENVGCALSDVNREFKPKNTIERYPLNLIIEFYIYIYISFTNRFNHLLISYMRYDLQTHTLDLQNGSRSLWNQT